MVLGIYRHLFNRNGRLFRALLNFQIGKLVVITANQSLEHEISL